jgi:hypothetical protein
MSFSNSLYYPWIEIEDDAWLRSACLYWDRIHTIVPASLAEPYTNAVSVELHAQGVLEPVRVNPGLPEIESLAPEVAAYLDSPEGRNMLDLRSVMASERINSDKLPRAIRRLIDIHPEKLPREVGHLLRASPRRGEWLQVHPAFGEFYMTLLATTIAQQRHLSLLTPSLRADLLANSARSGRRFLQPRQPRPRMKTPSGAAEGVVVDLILSHFAIAPDVSIKKLLAFRRKHSAELGHLRSKIAELAEGISVTESLEAARQHAKDIITNEVTPAVSNLKAALRGSRITTVTEGLLKVSFFSAAPTSALVAAGLAMPAALAVGATLSLIATGVLMSVSKQKLLRENPFSYLFGLQKKFE